MDCARSSHCPKELRFLFFNFRFVFKPEASSASHPTKTDLLDSSQILAAAVVPAVSQPTGSRAGACWLVARKNPTLDRKGPRLADP
jgi:hypothetical protein